MTDAIRGAAFNTPLGTLVAVAGGNGLSLVSWELDDLATVPQASHPVLSQFRAWILAYFDGQFHSLPPVPLDLPPAPSLPAWIAARSIPAGRTMTYGALAGQMGRPGAGRAVGAAMAHNPLMLIVPCHRVVAQTGSLQGYRGGVERKAWLLRHEGALLL